MGSEGEDNPKSTEQKEGRIQMGKYHGELIAESFDHSNSVSITL